MKLEDQVCSLDLAKRLKELGAEQHTSMFEFQKYSLKEKPMIMFVGGLRDLGIETAVLSGKLEWRYAAFTVAELGEMLPEYAESMRMIDEAASRHLGKWYCEYNQVPFNTPTQYSAIEADARAKMLVHLLENNLIAV